MEDQEAGTIRLDDTTAALARAICRGRTAGQSAPSRRGQRATGERPGELETRASPFIGREREIASLQSLLEETRDEKVARSVLLLGPPGLGKSRLLRDSSPGNPDGSLPVAQASGTLLRIERRYPALASVLAAAGVEVQGKSSQHVEVGAGGVD
jgi:hypothetical protein